MTDLVLVVDDLRTFRPELVSGQVVWYARNSDEGIGDLKRAAAVGETVNQMWLDYDLGMVRGRIDTIWPVVEYMTTDDSPMPLVDQVIVHTSNPAGRRRVLKSLQPRWGTKCLTVDPSLYFTVDL